jgi:hypothetical protein
VGPRSWKATTALVVLLLSIGCKQDGAPDVAVRLTPGALAWTVAQGTSSEATIMATAEGAPPPRLHLRVRVEGRGLELVETASAETHAVVRVRSPPHLPVGRHVGNVAVAGCTDAGCGESLRVPYTVTVVRPLATPNPVSLTVSGGSPAEAEVTVAVPAGAAGFDVAVSAGAGWLSVPERSATGFRVRAAPWHRGRYEGALRVTAGGVVELVQVRCDVLPKPMVIEPGSLVFTGVRGTSDAQEVNVSLPNDATEFEVEARPGWLILEKTRAGVVVRAAPGVAGAHEGSLTFTAGSSRVVVPVHYWEQPAGDALQGIAPMYSGLTLSAQPGQEVAVTYLPVPRPVGFPPVLADVAYLEGGAAGWLLLEEAGPGFLVRAYTASLAPGVYRAEVVLHADAEAPEVRVPVAFTYGEGLETPSDRHIDVTGTTVRADLHGSVRIALVDGAAQAAWSATADAPWLAVYASSGTTGEVLAYYVDHEQLPMMPGAVPEAVVTLRADDAAFPPTQFRVRVARRMGVISGVTPYIQPAGKPSRVLVRGALLEGDELSLGLRGTGWVETTVRGPGEFEVHLPALFQGEGGLSLRNQLSLPGTHVNFYVYDPVAMPLTHFPETGGKRGLTYDPLRRAILLVNADQQAIVRWEHRSSGWTTSRRSIQGLVDIGLTTDGGDLLATTTTGEVMFLDPSTLETRSLFLAHLNAVAPTPSAGIPALHGGLAWIVSGGNGWAPRFQAFDVLARYPARGIPFVLQDAPYSSTSRDRSRVLFSQPQRPAEPIYYVEGLEYVPRAAPIADRFTVASQSDDGGRMILDGTRVYDRSFAFLGSVEVPAPYQTHGAAGYGAVLSPDGNRAYVLAYTPLATDVARLFVVDTSQAPPSGAPFPILGSRELGELAGWEGASPAPALLAVAPDELNVFIATTEELLVLPTSGLVAAPAP